MRLAIVPMKPLATAKARLAPSLTTDERRTLSLAMLTDVLVAAREFGRVWVLHSDEAAARVARECGAEPHDDPAPGAGLNASLSAATALAADEGVAGLLVVSADVPAVRPEDLEALASSPGVAIATDSSGTGTNALWRSPAHVVDVAFGASSRQAHEAAARLADVPFRAPALPRLAVDVDTPDDLASVWSLGPGPSTREALRELGLAARFRLAV